MHTETSILKILEHAEELINISYRKIAKGKSFWERSPLEDAFDAMDKLYACHIYQREREHSECDISLGKTIVNKMQNLHNIVLDTYGKTLKYNTRTAGKIKKATLLLETARNAVDVPWNM